jgi:hypothetical protein
LSRPRARPTRTPSRWKCASASVQRTPGVDVWNGITVLVAPYSRPTSEDLVLTVVNYAAQPLPIQLRVRGTFSEVQYEAPGQPAVLLSFEVRNGGT